MIEWLWANSLITKLTFRFTLLKRAYTRSEFVQFLSKTIFGAFDIKEDLSGWNCHCTGNAALVECMLCNLGLHNLATAVRGCSPRLRICSARRFSKSYGELSVDRKGIEPVDAVTPKPLSRTVNTARRRSCGSRYGYYRVVT
jgi:hypothetical protein